MAVHLNTDENPENLTLQLYEILLKSARRCAYDLRHAVDCIDKNGPDGYMKELLAPRADNWVDLFSSGTNIKDYRLSYIRDIAKLELEVQRLQKLIDPEKHPWDAPGKTFADDADADADGPDEDMPF